MSGFYLTVSEARESKESSYQDAFAPETCEDCGTPHSKVYNVSCNYGGTVVLHAFCTGEEVGPAVLQALSLFERLAPRMDRAQMEWEANEAEREAREAQEAEAE